MAGFRDATGSTRAATIVVCLYMALDPLAAFLRFRDPMLIGPPAAWTTLAALFVTIVCFVVVGRWIYLTNANAHVLSSEMTIKPGWAVGWFFVPIANLFMPYQGVKETWQESHEAAGLYEAAADSSLLRWWWGLWIATNILGNVTFMLGGGSSGEGLESAGYFDLLSSALNIPLSLILIRLMQRLARIQLLASEGSVFE